MTRAAWLVGALGSVLASGLWMGEAFADRERPASGIGVALEAGGGVSDFTRGQLADVTSVGGAWAVRLLIGTRWYVGGEFAYVGSANKLSFGSANTDAYLIGNGLEGALRLQIPIVLSDTSQIQPYILGGAGWHRYNVSTGNDLLDRLSSGTDGLGVPVGGGLLAVVGRLLIDLRAQYRFGFYNNPIRSSDSSSGTDTWSLTAHLGVEF